MLLICRCVVYYIVFFCMFLAAFVFYNLYIDVLFVCSSCDFCSVFFFFKQKTAYEMRISDWSSDVCSSDLCNDHQEINVRAQAARGVPGFPGDKTTPEQNCRNIGCNFRPRHGGGSVVDQQVECVPQAVCMDCVDEIGRASCRERVCQYV